MRKAWKGSDLALTQTKTNTNVIKKIKFDRLEVFRILMKISGKILSKVLFLLKPIISKSIFAEVSFCRNEEFQKFHIYFFLFDAVVNSWILFQCPIGEYFPIPCEEVNIRQMSDTCINQSPFYYLFPQTFMLSCFSKLRVISSSVFLKRNFANWTFNWTIFQLLIDNLIGEVEMQIFCTYCASKELAFSAKIVSSFTVFTSV